ncbi:SprT family zinc-dependent metalloprotease [Primorskyibacter aestuariivivens]|uniref:M48 family metallopeptidase n=1 Tax=Primorskyibacter aestuariivivens TaxID=1888912 RepID=UPI002301FD19|nr:SprT family zinc-dependent metalloprotease [Primorskyibacter aestuariivivens]MDA7428359.1 SprT family zinc-dependent metalloprotease [Primorskyibacter aestuariivivens]
MGYLTLPGNPPLTVKLRRSARARRMTLRISSLDATVTLTVPDIVRDTEAQAFARDKEAWLRRHLDAQGAPVQVALGQTLPIEGVLHEIVAGQGRSVIRRNGKIHVPTKDDRVAARLQGFLKTEARARLAEASDLYAARLGRSYNRITLRDTRSRWGSCSSRGALMYSWRLIMAPRDVLDYVVAHEVAHLEQMNHSSAFWQTVERIYGDYSAPRRWLRQDGMELHRIRFD